MYNDARVMGMGGTFTAVADDKNMLFYNPAGFADYGLKKTSVIDAIIDPTLWKPRYTNIGDLTLFSLTLGINSNLYDKYDYVKKLYDMDFFNKFSKGTLTPEEAEEANKQFIKLYYTILHPRFNGEYFSYARHYFGVGIFSASDFIFSVEPGGFFPNVAAQFHSDIIFPVGIGIHIPGYKRWSVGITFKYFQRAKVEINNINDMAAFYHYVTGNYIDSDKLKESFDSKSIWDLMLTGVDYTSIGIEQMKIGTGMGFDVGLMYRYSYAWRFGLQISDVYTRIRWWDNTEPSPIPINARAGVAYKPAVSLWGFFEDPIIALDIEDIFHQQKKNFFLKWHFGTEFKLLFRIITLRFGINEGYPSCGLGLDLNFYFLSKIPILKWLRPDNLYFPKFDPNDKEFLAKNPFCCLLTGILAPILYAHIKIDISYTGYELGPRPGDLSDYQLLCRLALSYSYK